MLSGNLFQIRDCNLSLIATGTIAESLIEFRTVLEKIPQSSLYYHFWGARLHLSFAHPEYHNDFAQWAHYGLHDEILTERLAIIDPTDYPDLEGVRKKLIDLVEERIEELEYFFISRKENKFHFLRSVIIVFDMEITTQLPQDLKTILPKLPPTSIFYHFIDARRRTLTGEDDFSCWLSYWKEEHRATIQKIKDIDPYFLSLLEIKQRLIEIFNELP